MQDGEYKRIGEKRSYVSLGLDVLGELGGVLLEELHVETNVLSNLADWTVEGLDGCRVQAGTEEHLDIFGSGLEGAVLSRHLERMLQKQID